jgi:hypothetical protein
MVYDLAPSERPTECLRGYHPMFINIAARIGIGMRGQLHEEVTI